MQSFPRARPFTCAPRRGSELPPRSPQPRLASQVLRPTFSRYLALTRRAMSDATALVAARGAGISVAGRPLVPTADLLAARPGPAQAAANAAGGAQWSVTEMVGGLYVVKNDIARLESVAKELGPKDR